jgi:ubiquinone/menaquinone biosynthesis C-methylase UbiE
MTPKANGGKRAATLLLLPLLAIIAFSACRKSQDQRQSVFNKENEPEAFDRIARTLFAGIYRNLAKQIKEDYSITKGTCIDVGGGPGYLAIELAKITELTISALDINPFALRIAQKNIEKAGVSERVKTIEADVHKMPFPDGSADLVVSRGSYLFWKDKVTAFKEIYRILKPGGMAFVGGGMGNLISPEEREKIRAEMEKKKIGPPKELEVSLQELSEILRKAGIPNYKITTDAGCLCGLWAEFKKPPLVQGEGPDPLLKSRSQR